MRVRANNRGFTLIEIMLVVLIIGVIAAMVVPNLAGRGEQARKSVARADIDTNIDSSLGMYEMDNGRYPSTEQGLEALVAKPSAEPVPASWNGPYLKKKFVPKDPWGKPYVYRAPGTHNTDGYDLFSTGPDGVESADDITNWQEGT